MIAGFGRKDPIRAPMGTRTEPSRRRVGARVAQLKTARALAEKGDGRAVSADHESRKDYP